MPAEPFKYDGVLDKWKCDHILKFCGKSALDIGCNTGNLVAFLNNINIYAEGIDSSQHLVFKARTNNPDCLFHCGIDLSIFSDNQFESVIAWNVLEHIEDDSTALKEMMRIASKNVILSIPKEDELSLPDSRITYRPYVDPTHVHYYTRDILTEMISKIGNYPLYLEDVSRVRPLLAYAKIGIPHWLCSCMDSLLWAVSKCKEPFYANLIAVIDVADRPAVAGLPLTGELK